MRIDDRGVWTSPTTPDRVTVEFEGRRVWSFAISRDGVSVAGARPLVPWPDALVPHLNGRAHVLLRSSDSGEVLFEAVVTFGHGDGALVLVDEHGQPLAVSKTRGVSSAMFSDARPSDREQLVETVVRALDLLRAGGHDAFLVYGNLLGAVRTGSLIGHDDDADIAYLSRARHPVDLMLESFRIERRFIQEGWTTTRFSGGTFKLLVAFPGGLRLGIDVFTAFHYDGTFHMMPFVGADLPLEALVPTSSVILEGREVAAPADPVRLLESTFGPGWRVPDPTFRHHEPRWLRRRLGGWLRGDRRHQKHWDNLYTYQASEVPTEPSPFARWVVEGDRRPTSLVDIGSGNGRDAVWFAEQGIQVVGCDYSPAAVALATGWAQSRGAEVRFRRLSLYNLRSVLGSAALLGREHQPDAVYARFLVHALEDEGRRNLWRFSRAVLAGTRGRLYLEFRTGSTEHPSGEHYRRFVDAQQVTAELAGYGFVVEHREDGHGLAVFGGEDPKVCRIVAKLER